MAHSDEYEELDVLRRFAALGDEDDIPDDVMECLRDIAFGLMEAGEEWTG